MIENLNKLNARMELGTIVRGPVQSRFFRQNIVQHEEPTISIDGDDELAGIEKVLVSCSKWMQNADKMNAAEPQAFGSDNSSIAGLGVYSSRLSPYACSMQQQRNGIAFGRYLSLPIKNVFCCFK